MSKDHYPYSPAGHDSTVIEVGNQTLFRQAPMTADTYLSCAIVDIDEKLGKGYAKEHPELIAAYMQTSALDLGTSIMARAIDNLVEKLPDAERLLEVLRTDHPLQGQTLDGIEQALLAIAEKSDG